MAKWMVGWMDRLMRSMKEGCGMGRFQFRVNGYTDMDGLVSGSVHEGMRTCTGVQGV